MNYWKYEYWDRREIATMEQEAAAIREKLSVYFHKRKLGDTQPTQVTGWHICCKCGKKFYLSPGEVDFFRSKSLHIPKRCPKCREKNCIEHITNNVRSSSPSGYTAGEQIGTGQFSQQGSDLKNTMYSVDLTPACDIDNPELYSWLRKIALEVIEQLEKNKETVSSDEEKCIICRTIAVYWMTISNGCDVDYAVAKYLRLKKECGMGYVNPYKYPELFAAVDLSKYI